MKILFALFIGFTLFACSKDKLEQSSTVLAGTWKWHHSIEYTYDSANDTVVGTVINATNFSDTYGVRIEEKGFVYTIKNGTDEEKYRLILPYFKSGSSVLMGGYDYIIRLDNKDNQIIEGAVTSDTLTMTDLHLPLETGSSQFPHYTHYYVK